MLRTLRILSVFALSSVVVNGIRAQQPQPVQMASLQPGHELVLHRVSPSPERPDGPVLYQLLLNASGTPGTVPVFDTNPRHLTNSPITITSGNVVIGGGSGLTINGSTGLVTFANGQIFPGSVNSVTALDSFINIGGTAANPTVGLKTINTDARYLTLTGGTMTGAITFAAGQTFPSTGLPNLAGEVTGPVGTTVVSNAVSTNTANAVVRRDGTGNFSAGTVTLSGNLALPATASASVGVLTLGGASFLHNFGTNNTFVGNSAGNFGMSGSYNAALGTFALLGNTSGNYNSAFGSYSLDSSTTASGNSSFGYSALNQDSTGSYNSAFGELALFSTTTSSYNAAFGFSALAVNTTGQYNAAFGANALASNTTASNNTAFGTSALQFNTTGTPNDAFGFHALFANTTGTSNAAFGDNALAANTTGISNAAFGASALRLNTTGIFNSAFGSGALQANTTGASNSAFGTGVLTSNTTGGANAAFGLQALGNNTTGNNNAAFGPQALLSNTTGINNAAFGSGALQNNPGFSSNAAFGANALKATLAGGENSAFGASALQANTAADNAAFGFEALFANTTGTQNAAFGVSALHANTTANASSAFGFEALLANTTGVGNSAFGDGALANNTSGGSNAAFGGSALITNSTGDGNTALGAAALANLVSGGFNIAIGQSAASSLNGNETNNIDIGNSGVSGESNTIRIGSNQTATFIAGISGTTVASGTGVLVNSNGQLGTILSSRRYKQDIADLGAESDILMKLRPVAFYYKPELDSTHTRQYGLVAEEVAQIAPGLVVFDNNGRPETVRYHFVNAMLLNEVQKQRRLIEAQQKQLADQQEQVEHLSAALASRQAADEQQLVLMREQMKILMLRMAAMEKSAPQHDTQLAASK
jgi:hypothetical protein